MYKPDFETKTLLNDAIRLAEDYLTKRGGTAKPELVSMVYVGTELLGVTVKLVSQGGVSTVSMNPLGKWLIVAGQGRMQVPQIGGSVSTFRMRGGEWTRCGVTTEIPF